jgi:3-deoxy-D-manno-octulosonate 8-phosphate phosphatase (KDO 8-P phosphatase)
MMSEENKPSFFEKLKRITTFIFDVDGVLTNGTVFASTSGELLRSFNTKDGYALQLAVKNGYNLCIISGGKGEGTHIRFKNLGIPDIHLGVHNKIAVYQEYLQKRGIDCSQVMYMGDDIPDMEVMKLVELACCPADAAEEIKAICHYISPFSAGNAAARDVIEKVMKIQGKWLSNQPSAAESSL